MRPVGRTPGEGPGPALPSVPAAVEAVLDSLRRGQRQLARNPRAAIETAVRQLLSFAQDRATVTTGRSQPATYRIDDLARASGTTVRNIRAYQERGLLHPPARVGRTAVFDDTHLSRLKIITSMLDRGYTSAHILEMLAAWEHGRDLADVLGLEHALVVPRLEDSPVAMTSTAARQLAGGPAEFDQLVAAGLIEVTGNRVRVLRPKLLEAFAEMRGYGMPLQTLIKLHLDAVPAIDRISRLLVAAGAAHLADRFAADAVPTSADVDELVALLTRFRELATGAVMATLAASVERTIEELLTDYLAQFVRSAADTG